MVALLFMNSSNAAYANAIKFKSLKSIEMSLNLLSILHNSKFLYLVIELN